MTPAVQLGVLITALVAIATLQLGPTPANGYVQMSAGRMGAYCNSEGYYCRGHDSCCSGLKCVKQIGGIRGLSSGVCQQDTDVQAELPSPAFTSGGSSSGGSCSSDADCPAGQCCTQLAVGFRGGLSASCQADCQQGGREFGDILGDFYSRYYRRSLRAGKTHHKSPRHHQDDEKASEQAMQHAGHAEEKKKRQEKKKKAQH